MLIGIKMSRNLAFSDLDNPRILFFLLINDKMPTIVGIFTYMRRTKFVIFIMSGPVCSLVDFARFVQERISSLEATFL